MSKRDRLLVRRRLAEMEAFLHQVRHLLNAHAEVVLRLVDREE